MPHNFFCCFVFRFREITHGKMQVFLNQPWWQMHASLISIVWKNKSFVWKGHHCIGGYKTTHDLLNWSEPFIFPFLQSSQVLFILRWTGILPSCFTLSNKIWINKTKNGYKRVDIGQSARTGMKPTITSWLQASPPPPPQIKNGHKATWILAWVLGEHEARQRAQSARTHAAKK